MINAAFVLGESAFRDIYGDEVLKEIEPEGRLLGPPITARDLEAQTPAWAPEMEVLFTGWGGPHLTRRTLDLFPKLRVVFHGAGTLRSLIEDDVWPQGIQFTAAAAFNAVPTSEFAFGAILLSLKRAWQHAAHAHAHRAFPFPYLPLPGGRGSKIGVVSLGQIGRRVIARLRTLDVDILAHDPFAEPERFTELGARQSTLEELFSQSDIVSLHAPLLPSTRGIVDGRLLDLLKPNATLINTARGGLIKEDDFIPFLRARPDVQAILDVTDPEPPAPESPLWDLPNVFLTPHIAGSLGPECRRMGHAMVEEFRRYARGEPLRHAVTREQFKNMA
jgi:phosphoglycerate dehydrogenase-like enzyme